MNTVLTVLKNVSYLWCPSFPVTQRGCFSEPNSNWSFSKICYRLGNHTGLHASRNRCIYVQLMRHGWVPLIPAIHTQLITKLLIPTGCIRMQILWEFVVWRISQSKVLHFVPVFLPDPFWSCLSLSVAVAGWAGASVSLDDRDFKAMAGSLTGLTTLLPLPIPSTFIIWEKDRSGLYHGKEPGRFLQCLKEHSENHSNVSSSLVTPHLLR